MVRGANHRTHRSDHLDHLAVLALEVVAAARDEVVGADPSAPAISSRTALADEPATARALADFVLRGLDCGAVDATEVRDGCGLDDAELRSLAKR